MNLYKNAKKQNNPFRCFKYFDIKTLDSFGKLFHFKLFEILEIEKNYKLKMNIQLFASALSLLILSMYNQILLFGPSTNFRDIHKS